MATLTFCKLVGNRDDDNFRGTFCGPTDMPGEWDFLLRNSQLAEWNIKLRVIEAKSIAGLDVPYRNQIKKTPHLYLKGSAGATEYPNGQPLKEKDIVAWIRKSLTNVISTEEVEQPPVLTTVNDTKNAESVEKLPAGSNTGTIQPEDNGKIVAAGTPSDKVLISSLVGGSILVAACAVAGAIAGMLISRDDPMEDIEPLLLVGEDGRQIPFNDIWNERGPNVKQIQEKSKNDESLEKEAPLANREFDEDF